MKRRPPWLWPAIVLAIVLVGLAAWRLFAESAPASSLTVRILSPQQNQFIQAGEGLAIVAYAEAGSGLSAVKLIEDGELYAEHLLDAEPSFTAVFSWYAESIGSRHLQVVAIDAAGNSTGPVEVYVGVRSALAAEGMDFAYIPSEAGIGTERIEPVVGGLPEAASGEEPEWLDPSAEVAPEGEPLLIAPPLDDDFAALPNAADAAPLISTFNVEPQRAGNQVALIYMAEASDDLGLDRIEISVQNLAGESSNLTIRCFGEPTCLVDGTFPFASPGQWLVGLHAIDTSGQSSGPSILSVGILADPILPPAIAILQPSRANISPANRFADGAFAVPVNISLLEPIRSLFDAVTAETACLEAAIEPRVQGHLILAVFLCEQAASQSSLHLKWEVEAIPAFGIGSGEAILEREYEDRHSVFPLDNFSFLYQNPVCGTWITYRLSFSWVNRELTRQATPAGTIDLREVPTPPCGSATLVQDLQAIPVEQGIEVSWRFNHDAGVNQAIQYRLYRSLPGQPASSTLLSQGDVPEGALANVDLVLSFLDGNLACGFQPYVYTLATDYTGPNDPGLAAVKLDHFPCAQGSIGTLQIDLEPGYALLDEIHGNPLSLPAYRAVVTARTEVPAGFPWPAEDNLVLLLNVRSSGRGGTFEPLPGNAVQLAITDDIRTNGFTFESTALVECSGYHHQWSYSWELLANGGSLETGPEFQVASPACLPDANAAPVFTSIRGGDGEDCGGQAYCVILEWGPIPDFPANVLEANVLLPVDRLGVYRLSPSIEGAVAEVPPQQLWAVSVASRQYRDDSIVCTNRAGDLIYRYTLVPMAQGLHGGFGRSTAFIPSPACSQPYDAVGSIR